MVTQRKLSNYKANELHTTILQTSTSTKAALFIPDKVTNETVEEVRAKNDTRSLILLALNRQYTIVRGLGANKNVIE